MSGSGSLQVASCVPRRTRLLRIARQGLWIVIWALWAVLPVRIVDAADCSRIVSAAPSVTELLFDIGLGGNVVARSRFCRFPPEAEKLPAIGGFLDPNLEYLVALRPSIVALLVEHDTLRRQLQSLGIASFTVDHRRLGGIRESYRIVGRECGTPQAAEKGLAAFDAGIDGVTKAVAGLPRIRTIVVVGKTLKAERIAGAYISGSDGYYADLVPLAGGVLANEGSTVQIPSLSEEGLRHLAPQAIVDVVDRDDSGAKQSDAVLQRAWQEIGARAGLERLRVIILRDDFASVPGPRTPRLLERMARLLHPEAGQGDRDG